MEWEGRAPSRPNTPSHPYSGRIVDASLPFIMPYHKSSNHKSQILQSHNHKAPNKPTGWLQRMAILVPGMLAVR